MKAQRGLSVTQTQGILALKEKCFVNLKIGNISNNVEIFVLRNNLPYVLIGLPHCKLFKLNIDCVKMEITQNKIVLPLMEGIPNIPSQNTLHLNEDKQNFSEIENADIFNEWVEQYNVEATEDVQNLQSANNSLPALLSNYTCIFSKNKYDVGRINMEPQRIHLTSDLPISLRAYRTSPKEEEEIREQIQNLLQAGIIKESYSPYSSPVTLVYKREEGKKTRLCVDFRKLNAITKTDAEPLPRIDTLLDKLAQAKVFSTLDLASGYWHIPIHPKDTEKLAFATTFGLYEWLYLPFGLRNAPAIFNRTIRRILNKYKIDFACNYFDDIIVFSQNENEHFQHLKTLFDICVQENLKLKLSKCNFVKTTINFLGYEVSNGCITPDNPNIETIKKLQPPTNVKELQRFLGSINVYNKFIPKYAKIRYPLNNLLKKNVPYVWDQNCQNSFQKLKQALIEKPILKLFDPKTPCQLFVDASSHGVGCVVKQVDEDGILHPIAYHSRNLRDYEKNYAITELECLAIVDALDKFYHYLHGQKFFIHTDHAALTWLKTVKNLRGRLFRWSLKLSMFDYEIKYKKGSTNIEADMLSRQPVSENLPHHVHLLDLNEIREIQKKENVIVNGKKYIEVNDVIVVKKKSLYKIVVPMSLRLPLLEKTHTQFGHPGIYKMINLITPQYYWPNVNNDIEKYVKHCHTCQINKKSKQKRFGLLQQVPPTDNPFECLALDSVGGLNYYNSTKKYLHLVIDHATRYVWGFPSKRVTTETYTNFLKQIFQMQMPQKLLTDRNPAFTASRFSKFLRNQKVKHIFTSKHHPETNGKIERLNQTIVTRLKCKVNTSSSRTPWTKLLAEVLDEYNNTPHSVTQFTPNYLLYGKLPYDPLLPNNNYYPPIDEARKLAKERTINYHKKNKVRYDVRFLPVPFKVGDTVMYEEFHYPNTRKLSPPYSGPYTILNQLSEVNFEIDKPEPHFKRNSEIVHSSKLRFYNPPENLKLNHQ